MELTQGVRFDTLELSPEILRALMERNIVQSTPVQAGCIPPMLEWRDVIAKAPTGTGKTFAFGIPMVEHVDPSGEDVQALREQRIHHEVQRRERLTHQRLSVDGQQSVGLFRRKAQQIGAVVPAAGGEVIGRLLLGPVGRGGKIGDGDDRGHGGFLLRGIV